MLGLFASRHVVFYHCSCTAFRCLHVAEAGLTRCAVLGMMPEQCWQARRLAQTWRFVTRCCWRDSATIPSYLTKSVPASHANTTSQTCKTTPKRPSLDAAPTTAVPATAVSSPKAAAATHAKPSARPTSTAAGPSATRTLSNSASKKAGKKRSKAR